MAVITNRCIRCRKPTRKDGTCQNPECVRYTPASEENIEGSDENK